MLRKEKKKTPVCRAQRERGGQIKDEQDFKKKECLLIQNKITNTTE